MHSTTYCLCSALGVLSQIILIKRSGAITKIWDMSVERTLSRSLSRAASWASLSGLAAAFEEDRGCRDRLREKGYMTRWPDVASTGVPSVKAMSLNARLLEILATWWCQRCDFSKPLPIDLMRREVQGRPETFLYVANIYIYIYIMG